MHIDKINAHLAKFDAAMQAMTGTPLQIMQLVDAYNGVKQLLSEMYNDTQQAVKAMAAAEGLQTQAKAEIAKLKLAAPAGETPATAEAN